MQDQKHQLPYPKHILDSLPKGYEEQRERIIQLLKDHSNPYATDITCNPKAPETQHMPEIPHDEVSDGHWNMTPEMERQLRMLRKGDIYAKSRQIVELELEVMKRSVHYYALKVVFLGDAPEYWAYENLVAFAAEQTAKYARQKKKLKKRVNREAQHKLELGWSKKAIVMYASKAHADLQDRYPEIRLHGDLQLAIHDLTIRLIDVHLEAIKPTKTSPTNQRRISMEEKYREIYRVFASHCGEIAKTSKKYRNKAYKETVLTMNESRPTVERAVHFVEAGDPKETQSRTRITKKTHCGTYEENSTTKCCSKTTIKKEKT